MKAPLEEAEVKDMFSPTAADFSPMFKNAGTANLSISNIIHKAVVEWNELGAEAAAATGIKIVATSLDLEKPPEFKVNQPFLFFIVDHNEEASGASNIHKEEPLIVFAGRAKTLINEATLTTGLNY